MAGMLQIITYLLSFYLIVKGCEILQIALASNRENRGGIIAFGTFMLVVCILAALGFTIMQEEQAQLLSRTVLK